MLQFIFGFIAGFFAALVIGSVYAYYKGYANYRKRTSGNRKRT